MSKSKVSGSGNSYYTMNRLALIIGNHMCILKAKELADSALTLSSSDNPTDHTIALGLYTLAIEELGKAVILKEECFIDNDASPQKVPKDIFGGRRAHERKFKKGMDKLPPECKDFMVGTYLPFPSGSPITKRVGKNGPYVSIPADTSGKFFAKYTADVDMRMSCFFVDWDETDDRWAYHFPLEKSEELQMAISKFKEKIGDYDISTMIEQKQKQHQGG